MGAGMIACQYCGTSNRADATYCNSCGGLLPGAMPAAPRTPPASANGQAGTGQHATGRLPPQSRLAGHYLILKNVGQGGMAAVYEARDTRTNRVVAVKEMGQDSLSPEELADALESFRFEARTLTRLRHPNLPRVYEQFSQGTRHYLVMEYIDGQTLEQRLGTAGGAGLPEAEVLAWAAQLCSVLGYLHSQRPPIIFRDLKPSNIMVTRSGAIKLIDFGIARVFAPGRTRDTQVLGTPGYAPPEQYGKAQTDARADIYALGCTLYQLLSGYDPATTPFALPPLHSRNPRVAPYVQLAIERATRLDRDARYQTVAAFAQDLLHPSGMYFRTGECAHNRPELVALCLRQPAEAAEHLYSGQIEGWLRTWGDRQAAENAARAVRGNASRDAGLRAFVASLSSGAGSGVYRAAPTSPGASASGGYPSSGVPNSAGRSRAATVTRSAASTATAPAPVVTVQPRSISFGRLVAGQRGTQVFLVSAANGGIVAGKIASLAQWLVVDHAQFGGTSTIVQLWAETSKIPGPGVQQAQVQITCGNQQIFLPVTVEVIAAGAPRPSASAVNGQTASASGTASAAHAGQASAGPSVSTVRQTHPISPKYALARPQPGWLARMATSFVLAGGLSVGAFVELPALLQRLHVGVAGSWPLLLLTLLVAAALAVPGAWAGSAPWRSAGRSRAITIGAAVGLLAAVLATGPLVFTHNGQLLVAALASIGAAFGADATIGRAILVTADFILRRIRFFLLLATIVAGAWMGVVLTGQLGIGALVPLGLILGAMVGAALGSNLNRLLSRMTRVARASP